MKILTLRKKIVILLVNHVLVGTHYYLKKRKLLNSIGYEIGNNTKIVGPIYNSGTLKIGENCWIGKNLTIHGNGIVVIGDNCDIAPDVTFLTGGHSIGNSDRRAGTGQNYTINIGNGTWIGARSTFLGNISVGEGSVVASCACVCNNIERNMLVGGVPAKNIRRLMNELDGNTET